MPDAITVSNSSAIIGLELINRLELLRDCYEIVLIPEAVSAECALKPLPWLEVRKVQNESLVRTLELDLGSGESEAIVLATELSAGRLILDDKKARRAARQLGLPVTGLLAVLLQCKKQGFVPQLRPLLDELVRVHFRISQLLVQEALRQAGE